MNKMNRRKSNFVITLLLAVLVGCLVFTPMTKVLAVDGSKDVWIDNTVDKSVSHVDGLLTIRDTATETETNFTYSKGPFEVTFSNPKSAEVASEIENVKTELRGKLSEMVGNRTVTLIQDCEESESTGKVWDNRKYETIEDNDAILIGDVNEIMGGQTLDSQSTRTHIASGEYGKETFYTVRLVAEYSSAETPATTYSILDGGDQTINEGEDLVVTASGDVENLEAIVVNGEPLSEGDYSVVKGSTIATIFSNFLSTLETEVTHNLEFVYGDGSVGTTFTIAKVEEEEPTPEPTEEVEEKEKKKQKTGDNIMAAFVVFGIAIVGAVVTTKRITSK